MVVVSQLRVHRHRVVSEWPMQLIRLTYWDLTSLGEVAIDYSWGRIYDIGLVVQRENQSTPESYHWGLTSLEEVAIGYNIHWRKIYPAQLAVEKEIVHGSGAEEPGFWNFSCVYALTLLTLNPTSNGSLSVSFNNTSKYDIIQNSMVENVALVGSGHLPIQIRSWHWIYCLNCPCKGSQL